MPFALRSGGESLRQEPGADCSAGSKSRAAKSRSNKRTLVSDSEDESGGGDAAAADSDSEMSGSEFGPAEAGASSESDEVRLKAKPLAPLMLLRISAEPCCHCSRPADDGRRHNPTVRLLSGQSMADFLDDDDEETGAADGKKGSQHKGSKPAAKRKVCCKGVPSGTGLLDGMVAVRPICARVTT